MSVTKVITRALTWLHPRNDTTFISVHAPMLTKDLVRSWIKGGEIDHIDHHSDDPTKIGVSGKALRFAIPVDSSLMGASTTFRLYARINFDPIWRPLLNGETLEISNIHQITFGIREQQQGAPIN